MATLDQQLIWAAERGESSNVVNLLRAGASIDFRDDRGRTAVMAATHGNFPDTVGTLMAAGADINIQDDLMDNPFLYAGAEGLLDVLRIAIAFGADTTFTNRYGGTALIPAAERGHVEVVWELLTTTDVNVNHINNLGWTALLEAVVLTNGGPRHQRIVEMLIEYGADVDIRDKNGVTALQHARKHGLTAIVEILSR